MDVKQLGWVQKLNKNNPTPVVAVAPTMDNTINAIRLFESTNAMRLFESIYSINATGVKWVTVDLFSLQLCGHYQFLQQLMYYIAYGGAKLGREPSDRALIAALNRQADELEHGLRYCAPGLIHGDVYARGTVYP